VLVPWPTSPLRSGERAGVRVRVWGDDDDPSDWSATGYVETGLLSAADWTAVPITPDWTEDHDTDLPPPLLRRGFHVDAEVASARLYVTAHGLYEVELNGERVGDDAFSPGWTSYGSRLRYLTYDVTRHVRRGDNALGAWLGDGWYRGRLGFKGGMRNVYGTELALLAQLEVRLVDGTILTVVTDQSWKAAHGPILMSSLYDGETYDARLYPQGWSSPGFDDRDWAPVRRAEREMGTLVAPDGPPVRCTQTLEPVAVWSSPSGKTLLDFGQNLVGRLSITVDGQAGDRVELRHAEVLQHGELYTRPLRSAAATEVYTLDGSGRQTWEPRFTFHGFRYAEVTGWPGEDVADNVVAKVYHTDMERIGWFECSDPLLNKLHDNVVWSMRGNFVDVPTDCPQRDERLGWTGDIQVFAPTAAFLYDCAGMLSSWLKDVAVEQLPDGTVPWYVPFLPTDEMWTPPRPGAVWGDAAVLTPWDLYQAFGDPRLLLDQFESAKAWVDLVDRLAGESHVWDTGFQLGDWLDPAAPPEDPAAAQTDQYLVATAYFAWSSRHLAQIAEVLGRTDEAERYRWLADQVTTAFIKRYVGEGGRLASDTQTAYALALTFDLLPAEQREAAGARLADLVGQARNRIATGFAGTPLVTRALSSVDQTEAGYDLLQERECPSWLYAVEQGGTTIWERWDSMLPDGSVNPGHMTSFNHYALGAVADWMHSTVAGLEQAEPGYRVIRFRPRPGGSLTFASARHETPYGEASIRWDLDGAASSLTVSLTVPTGTTGIVDLPGEAPFTVDSGRHSFTRSRPS
jgi:alpha-L-rhamnosidase